MCKLPIFSMDYHFVMTAFSVNNQCQISPNEPSPEDLHSVNGVPVVSRYQVLIETVGIFSVMYQYFAAIPRMDSVIREDNGHKWFEIVAF